MRGRIEVPKRMQSSCLGAPANARRPGSPSYRSQGFSALRRMSLVFANGSRTRATPSSPPRTRMVRTPNLTGSWSTPKSSSLLRKCPSPRVSEVEATEWRGSRYQIQRMKGTVYFRLEIPADHVSLNSFHPGYLTAERLAKAKKLKLAITAGIGSDHVDLNAANKTNGGITVAEVTGSNVVSVAEHVVMTILVLIRNFVPAHEQVERGEWDVAAVAKQEYDLEGKVVGTVGVGRIGERVLRRLKAFDCDELLYYDYQPLPKAVSDDIGCTRVENLVEMLKRCDIVTINCPLHEKTKGLFNKELISHMKPGKSMAGVPSCLHVISPHTDKTSQGSYLINTARGAIVVKEDVAHALEHGPLAGYGGDVWFPQPAPGDHPLRTAKNPFGGGNAMVPHMSGTSLDAQKRYADGTKAILESYLSGKHDYRPEDLIVHNGDYATKAYGQRK